MYVCMNECMYVCIKQCCRIRFFFYYFMHYLVRLRENGSLFFFTGMYVCMYVCMYEQVTFTDLRPETKYTVYVVEDKLVDPKGKLVITDDIKDTCILQVAFSMHTYIPYIRTY